MNNTNVQLCLECCGCLQNVVWLCESISQQVWYVRMNNLLQYYQGWTSPSLASLSLPLFPFSLSSSLPSLPLFPLFPSSLIDSTHSLHPSAFLSPFLPPSHSSLRSCKLSVLPPNWQSPPVSSQWQHAQGLGSPWRKRACVCYLCAVLSTVPCVCYLCAVLSTVPCVCL